jgi:hypothetical protein
MATQVQNRRGTTAEHSTFTGANGELTVDTTKRTLVVHDGTTAGGRPLLREDQSNLPTSAPTTGIYNNSGALAISTNGTGRLFVEADGSVNVKGSGTVAILEVGGSPSGNQVAAIDLIGDTTYSDYGLRIIRDSTGANAASQLNHRGTGDFAFNTVEAAPIIFRTNNSTERLRITSAGLVGVGTSTPQAITQIRHSSTAPSLSTNTGAGLAVDGTSTVQVNIGTYPTSPYAGWIQARDTGANSAYPIVINPLGGSVGVGSTAPATQFSVQNASTSLGIEVDTTSGFASGPTVRGYYRAGSAYTPLALTGSQVVFGINDVEKARLDASGRLLVGTSSVPLYGSLQVYPSNANVASFVADSGYVPVFCWNQSTGNAFFAEFGSGTSYTIRGSISYDSVTGQTSYNTTSDYRAKTIIGKIDNPGQTIDNLNVYLGVMKDATQPRPMLIAHEAKEVVPYCVTGEKDAVDDKGNPIYQQMDHQVLVPLLIAEIQQLRARVAALEAP